MSLMLLVCSTGNDDTDLFAVQALIEDDADGPDVDFGTNFRWGFADDEALRRQVPVCSGSLRR